MRMSKSINLCGDFAQNNNFSNCSKFQHASLVGSLVAYRTLMVTALDVGTINVTNHDIWKSCITRFIQPEENNNKEANNLKL